MATRKPKTNAIVNMVAAQTAKAAAIVAKAEQTAAERIAAEVQQRMHDAAEVERIAGKKAEGMRAEAINMGLDAMRAAGLDAGEIKDKFADIFGGLVEAGDLSESTAKAYKNGVSFAVDRHIPWASNLHSTDGKVSALQAAGKKIPTALQKAFDEAVAKKQERAAKAVTTLKASREGVVKKLAAALVDARALGMVEAGDILSAILAINPLFVEPKADDTAPF